MATTGDWRCRLGWHRRYLPKGCHLVHACYGGCGKWIHQTSKHDGRITTWWEKIG